LENFEFGNIKGEKMIKKLRIKNFKSFRDFEIEFDKFNCVIAPNNAGKSNLITALHFLYYAISDVKSAIEEFGGFDNVKNIFLEQDYIEFDLSFFEKKHLFQGIGEEGYIKILKNLEITLNLKIFKNNYWEKTYKMKGRFGKKSFLLKEVDNFFNFFEKETKNIKSFPFEIEVFYTNKVKEKNEEYNKLSKIITDEIIKKEIIKIETKNKKDLLYTLQLDDLVNKNFSVFSRNNDLLNLSKYFYAYSFYPEIIKSSFKGGKELRFDGCNLVEVLDFIKEFFPNNFEKISNSLIGIVEELTDIKIDKDLIDRNILLLEEKNKFLPFNVTSDGTINLLAILTSIYESGFKKMISFDEIEKHLHLKAIDYILEILKSQYFQVAFTTQSTEIINNLDLKKDNLIFLYRDYDGFTKGINVKKIPNFNKKIKRYKDISTIIRNEVLGYLGDFDEN
jgi:predicted ATPase